MAKSARPKPPKTLAAAGKALWKSIISELEDGWQLDARELELLERACRCADELAVLEKVIDADGPTTKGSRGQTVVHPALGECRQLRLSIERLLRPLELADPARQREREPISTQRARHAAEARHRKSRGLAAVG